MICRLMIVNLVSLALCSTSTTKTRQLKLNGDFILGGLFPMHEAKAVADPSQSCGLIKEEKGIQRMEAMLYALDQINQDPDLLSNVTLGTFILDTCSQDTYALEQSMEFVKASLTTLDESQYRCEDGMKPIYNPQKPVVGVIGASSSSVSVMVANILRLFKIPQISYASTSTELSDKARFGYFSRVVPPDNFQAQAMVDVIKELGWNYVSTVAVEGDYGEKGIEYFKMLAEKTGLCIAVSEKITRNSRPEDFDYIIKKLVKKSRARGVVLFVDEDNCRKLLAASIRARKAGHFLWIGSDSWGAKAHPVREQEEAAEGAITILPKRYEIKGFNAYFRSLNPETNLRNPWFKPFWEQIFDCNFETLEVNTTKCTGNETFTKYEQEGLVPFVIDAVYAMAHALDDMIRDQCGNSRVLCKEILPIPHGSSLLQYIRNVSFQSLQNENIVVRFNKDGDAPGSYYIYQYQKLDGHKFDYKRIGEWSEQKLSLHLNRTKWEDGSTTIPMSNCSDPCPAGHVRAFRQGTCCWVCVPCRNDEYIVDDQCTKCPEGYMPRSDKVACSKLPLVYMTWESPWAIVPAVFAALGIVFTLFTCAVFIRFSHTPVIMASGRELCYLLLLGLLLSYGVSFVILARPTVPTCSLMRVGLGLCLSLCYSAIFTKTNRISRIFNRGIQSIKRPSYTSPRSQVVICLALVSVQLVFAIAWLIAEPPSLKQKTFPTGNFAVLQCGISSMSMIVSLIYNMLLIVLCTVYAFKTRKIPENFNEAKYIGFTMYSTCIVWLAFIPIYFSTNNDFKTQLASLCMCISISATVALGCLFTPKLYICLCQPYKNVRSGGTQSSASGACHSMRFARPTASAAIASVATAAVISSTRHATESSDIRSTTNGEVTSPSVEESSIS
ncbi:metabotropic glutamate receptor 7-like [Limulus polyphemus]|uniref:Metabotropic glutamate receptor 7-like n=1 Tax=Limulus polyphemus TaxID=6850 RepID=A0ABM1B535_LIMPO|nr:metabotropic glutamate receptor 7-like [Limulus polyphemus]